MGNTHINVEALAQVPVVLHTPFATAVEIPDVVPQRATGVIFGFADHAKTRQLLSCSSRTYTCSVPDSSISSAV
jgi:hypothetical protein